MSFKERIEEPVTAIGLTAVVLSIIRMLIASGSVADGAMFLLGVLLLAAAYFTAIYLRADLRKNLKYLGVILLMIPMLVMSFNATQNGGFVQRDFTAFALVFTLGLLMYVLYINSAVKLGTAVALTLILSSAAFHFAPAVKVDDIAWTGAFISDLDPYLYYRFAGEMKNTGYIPEKETVTYPDDQPTFERMTFMLVMFLGSMSVLLGQFGMTVKDVSMIYGGVMNGVAALALYLLVKELFGDRKPYNQIAAVFAIFMFMLSPVIGSKMSATNCEDDAMGMTLLILTLLFFVIAYNRKSPKFALLSGFTFLVLNMTWGGFLYLLLAVALFASVKAVINFTRKENCMEVVPYFAAATAPLALLYLIIHKQGQLPSFGVSWVEYNWMFIAAFIGAIGISVLLEFIRLRMYGRIEIQTKMEDFQPYITPLLVVMVVVGVAFTLFMGPGEIFRSITTLLGVKPVDIIAQTTQEQAATCSSILDKDCLNKLNSSMGIGVIFGLLAIPVLLYETLKRKGIAAPLILCLAVPMLWGVIGKGAYQFAASVPVMIMAASLAVYVPLTKKDFNSGRVIPLIILLGLPLMMSLSSSLPFFAAFGGSDSLHYGPMSDRIYWDPTLQWLSANVADERILTWWDYGHWIAAETGKHSLLDNTKGKPLMVQDVAKFHVYVTNESEALKIIDKYKVSYVIIDFTMIPKSGAPYYIATSNVENDTMGEHDSYGLCYFAPASSQLTVAYNMKPDGTTVKAQNVVFQCTNGIAMKFNIENDMYVGALIYLPSSSSRQTSVSWESWRQQEKASILGVQPFNQILANALQYGTDKYFDFPPYTTITYVPAKFNKFMMTSLYLGDYMDQYKAMGLCDESVQKLEHFKLVDGFSGQGDDYSYYGYVRVYKVVNWTNYWGNTTTE